MNDEFALFPSQFVKKAIQQYTRAKGYAPKILCVSSEDYVGYIATCSLPDPASLGLDVITVGEYLQSGEMDLALAIQEDQIKAP